MSGFFRCAAVLAALCVGLWTGGPGYAGPAEVSFLQTLEGRWTGQGRAATTQGETPVLCEVESQMQAAARISLRANCRTQGQSGNIGMSLYFSDMTQQFHGELTSPLNYISGGLNGRLSRGDLFLRLSADDGSEGRLLLVAQGSNQVRLLVTTIVDGANITVFDLPLARAG
ncbi:MAG: hypothetical protein ACE37E_03185 [Hyphomicrobiales bacterium]